MVKTHSIKKYCHVFGRCCSSDFSVKLINLSSVKDLKQKVADQAPDLGQWLLAIKLLLEGELKIATVAQLVGHYRNSIKDWIKLFRDRGIEALLMRGEALERKSTMSVEAKAQPTEILRAGEFRTNFIYYQREKLGGRRARSKSHLRRACRAGNTRRLQNRECQ